LPETKVLETAEGGQLTDGMIKDDDGDMRTHSSSATSWVPIARCAVNISGTVPGLMAPESRRMRASSTEGRKMEGGRSH
jgi:hypothetical protein